MRYTQQIMGMPVHIEVDEQYKTAVEAAFAELRRIDEMCSPYKPDSQVSRMRSGQLKPADAPKELHDIIAAIEAWNKKTKGYFTAHLEKGFDPSGYVKGWAIQRAADILGKAGASVYLVSAGGDMVLQGKPWSVGIRLPQQADKLAAKLSIQNGAIATSGNYERGSHITDPHTGQSVDYFASVSVIGPEIITCDVLATTLFAMGETYQQQADSVVPTGYEVYCITPDQQALYTPGFKKYRAD